MQQRHVQVFCGHFARRTFAALCVNRKRANKGMFGFYIFSDAAFKIGPVNENGLQYAPVTRLPDGPMSFHTVCLRPRATGS